MSRAWQPAAVGGVAGFASGWIGGYLDAPVWFILLNAAVLAFALGAGTSRIR